MIHHKSVNIIVISACTVAGFSLAYSEVLCQNTGKKDLLSFSLEFGDHEFYVMN